MSTAITWKTRAARTSRGSRRRHASRFRSGCRRRHQAVGVMPENGLAAIGGVFGSDGLLVAGGGDDQAEVVAGPWPHDEGRRSCPSNRTRIADSARDQVSGFERRLVDQTQQRAQALCTEVGAGRSRARSWAGARRSTAAVVMTDRLAARPSRTYGSFPRQSQGRPQAVSPGREIARGRSSSRDHSDPRARSAQLEQRRGPMPPPTHMLTTTWRTPRRRPSSSAWPTRRAPTCRTDGRSRSRRR